MGYWKDESISNGPLDRTTPLRQQRKHLFGGRGESSYKMNRRSNGRASKLSWKNADWERPFCYHGAVGVPTAF